MCSASSLISRSQPTADTARTRHDIRFGDVVTSEILGQAEAFLRPAVTIDVRRAVGRDRQRLVIEFIDPGRALPAVTTDSKLRPRLG